MESKKIYDEIYEDIIRSVQEFEEDNISERYDSLYDNFWTTKILYYFTKV